MPLLITPRISLTSLKTRDIGFPFCLTRKGGEAGHILAKIELVHSVHDHEQITTVAIYLHVKNPNLTLTGNNLRPHMSMNLNILTNHLLVINKS